MQIKTNKNSNLSIYHSKQAGYISAVPSKRNLYVNENSYNRLNTPVFMYYKLLKLVFFFLQLLYSPIFMLLVSSIYIYTYNVLMNPLSFCTEPQNCLAHSCAFVCR